MTGKKNIKRVKTGCLTCRIRKVKCDESRPACKRCRSTGRTCDGYTSLPFSRNDLQAAARYSSSASPGIPPPGLRSSPPLGIIPRLVSDGTFSDVLEKRYFQFFRKETVISANSLMDCRFWDRVVLQACHAEPAVKHAVLALESYHQFVGCGQQEGESAQQHLMYAEKQYHKALCAAKNLLDDASAQDVDTVLISCIIFILFEGVRGNYPASLLHMNSGRAILSQNRTRLHSASRRNDLTEIAEAVARLDVSASAFSDSSAVYHYTLEDFYTTSPNLCPTPFRNLNEARASLMDLVRWFLVALTHIDSSKPSHALGFDYCLAELGLCRERFQLWRRHFDHHLSQLDADASMLVCTLDLWYTTAQMIFEAGLLGPETRFDRVPHIFEHGVRIAERLCISTSGNSNNSASFSLDLGYTIPMFLVATRCRDPKLRRRALRTLDAHPRQEGIWASIPAATIAKRWITLEEAGLREVSCASDVPETNRIKGLDTLMVNVEQSTADLTFKAERQGEAKLLWNEKVGWKEEMPR